VKGRIAGFDVDTSHFTGNYPSACSIEACHSAEDPDEATEWIQLLAVTALGPNAHYFFAVHSDAVYSHVRLRIHPDGGIARLRVYGTPALDLKAMANETIDLASCLSWGRIVAFSNGHYGHARLIAPARGTNMGDGWETRRRREPGYDWIIVKLAARGHVDRIVVDTAHFKGNYPDGCSLQAADLAGVAAGCDVLAASSAMFWEELLPHRKLSADSIHEYGADMLGHADPVTHVRLTSTRMAASAACAFTAGSPRRTYPRSE
jgi:allantoicase